MLHLDPRAQLCPPRLRCCPPAQAVLEGLVLPNAYRAAVPQRRHRALRLQRAAIARHGRELDYRPQAQRLGMASGTGQGFIPQIESEVLLAEHHPGSQPPRLTDYDGGGRDRTFDQYEKWDNIGWEISYEF
jgi:hypothetical protein